MFSIGVGDVREYLSLFNELFIVYSFSSRNSQNSHPHCFVSRTESKAKEIDIRQNVVENSRGRLLRERSDTCSETLQLFFKKLKLHSPKRLVQFQLFEKLTHAN